jgi:hypothetical protein
MRLSLYARGIWDILGVVDCFGLVRESKRYDYNLVLQTYQAGAEKYIDL